MTQHSDQRPVLLITGCSGVIGKRLVPALAADHEVVGIDLHEPETVFPGDAWYPCDLTDDTSVSAALAKVRAHHGSRLASVIHLAAYYDFSGKPSPMYRDLTVEGTRRLVHQLQDFDVRQLIFSSSLLVMKPVKSLDARLTEASPLRAEWDYPRSKIEAERVLSKEQGKIPVVILRIAGVYDDTCNSLPLSRHIRRIYEKKLESYVFPGKRSHGQPFVHLDDLVSCFRHAITRRKELGSFETFLVAEPEVVSYEDLQTRIGELVHARAWPTIRLPKPLAKAGAWVKEKMAGEEDTFIKPWMIDLADDHYPVEIWRARSRLGWEPRHRLWDTLPKMIQDMLRDTRGWYERHEMMFPAEGPPRRTEAARR